MLLALDMKYYGLSSISSVAIIVPYLNIKLPNFNHFIKILYYIKKLIWMPKYLI